MGHSQNIRDWFGADSCWRAMARGDRFAALALLGGIWRAHGDGNQFRHHHSCSYGRHALVQPLSWEDHGGNAIGFWIRGFFRCTADQPDPDGEWRKLAASVGDCGRDFCVVRNCRVSVCEGASGRCLNTVTGHYYGPAAFPKVSGMMLVLAALFCAPAGYLGGKLFDLYHSYKLAFEVNSAVAAIGIVALFFARMPEPPAASVPVGK